MTEKELLDLIQQGEGYQVEFKREIDDASDIAAEIVAFANGEGGVLLLGVADDGSLYGLADPAEAERRLMGICRQSCMPAIAAYPESVTIGDKVILALQVPKGPDKPYRTSTDHFYVRVGSTRRRASREELYRLFQTAGFVQYDTLGVPGTSLDDLDLFKVATFFRQTFHLDLEEAKQSVPLERLLANAGLLTFSEDRYPATVGGTLFFAKDPQAILYASGVTAVRYRGTAMGEELLDQRDVTGTIPEVIEGVISFVRIHNQTPSRIEGARRVDRPQYPEIVVREAIVNAVAHRNYSITGSRIRVLMFDDRLEVRSPGRLPNTVTLENMRYGTSFIRNQLIVRLLNNYGYMDRLGRGVPMMIQAMREFSGQEPVFKEQGEEFWVTLYARQG